MTENPRTSLLQQARRQTAAIVVGTLAGTGLLTVAIAATASQPASQGLTDHGTTGTTTTQQSGSSGTTSDNSTSGVGSSSSSGGSDGGSSSS